MERTASFQSRISTVLNSGEKPCYRKFWYCIVRILLYRACCSFETVHLWKRPVCINILQFTLDNLCSTLYMPSTFVAPCRWLRFTVETCSSNKTNCAVSRTVTYVRYICAQRVSYKVPATLHTNELLQTTLQYLSYSAKCFRTTNRHQALIYTNVQNINTLAICTFSW